MDMPSGPSPTGGHTGRSNSPSDNSNQNAGTQQASVYCSSRQASVVIRATVEHIGLVGDTEMTVNVKWPASTFCCPPCTHSPAPGGTISNKTQVPGNGPEAHTLKTGLLQGESDSDPSPLQSATAEPKSMPSTGETAEKEASESNTQQAGSGPNQSDGEEKPNQYGKHT